MAFHDIGSIIFIWSIISNNGFVMSNETRYHQPIKVKNTKQLKVFIPNHNDFDSEIDILVSEAKLVLVECKYSTASFYERYDDQLVLIKGYNEAPIKGIGKYYKPILISETEKIETGDWYYFDGGEFKNLIQLEEPMQYTEERYKVLALPEHFSEDHLQAIVDGKLKDGDKVLVECEAIPNEFDNPFTNPQGLNNFPGAENEIKLNSSNHITLHKVEEKLVPLSIVLSVFKELGITKINGLFTEEWFEQNVK